MHVALNVLLRVQQRQPFGDGIAGIVDSPGGVAHLEPESAVENGAGVML
jgi:hypothetical protein